jgi:hypothetical protein
MLETVNTQKNGTVIPFMIYVFTNYTFVTQICDSLPLWKSIIEKFRRIATFFYT